MRSYNPCILTTHFMLICFAVLDLEKRVPLTGEGRAFIPPLTTTVEARGALHPSGAGAAPPPPILLVPAPTTRASLWYRKGLSGASRSLNSYYFFLRSVIELYGHKSSN